MLSANTARSGGFEVVRTKPSVLRPNARASLRDCRNACRKLVPSSTKEMPSTM